MNLVHAMSLGVNTLPGGDRFASAYVHRTQPDQSRHVGLYIHVTPSSMLRLYAAMETFVADVPPSHEDDAQSDEASLADDGDAELIADLIATAPLASAAREDYETWLHTAEDDEGDAELADESIEPDDAALAIVLGDRDEDYTYDVWMDSRLDRPE